MLRLGLSGGIGSGKSTVARRLVEHGAVLIDADVLAREVVEPGSAGLAQLVDAFGAGILDAEGGLDRPAMASRVFGDDDARARLNGIVHPLVAQRTAELMASAAEDAVVVHDVPLLVENGYAANYHLVLIVDAPEPDRVRRLVGRGLEESDARARIRAQATDEQRRAAADVWLDNSGSVDQLVAAVDRLWWDRIVEFEANVRLRTRASRQAPELVEHDSRWADQARRLMARVEQAAGPRAVRVDHIGSTAVPGLPAEDVIDLQLTVRSLADADALADPLGAAGLPVVPEVRADTAPDAEQQWVKRFHASADPGRLAHLHIRVAGEPGWRFALLFRDWLRAEPLERDAYLRLKREHAERFAGDGDHDRSARAEEPWFAEAAGRAEEWARRTGWTPPTV